jgi:polyhydroxyalkanoate synthesis regulator phasin
MNVFHRMFAALLLSGILIVTLPSAGAAESGANVSDRKDQVAQTDQRPDDGVDWEAIRTTAPEEWSEDLKAQLISAGYDLDRIAARVRKAQTDAVWREATHTPPEEWSEELRAKLLELKPGSTLREIAQGIRKRQQAETDRPKSKDQIGLRIRAAVAAGEITPEQGRRKYAAYLKANQQMHSDLETAGRRLKAAVQNGDMTEEEARRRYAAILEGKKSDLAPDLTAIRQRLATGVENGDISAEEARKRYTALLEKQKSNAPDLEAIGHRLKAAVENGAITAEEARRRYAAFLKSQQAGGWDGGGTDRLAEFKRKVVAEAMATSPSEWSDDLKAEITRAGWDVDEFSTGILARQEHTNNPDNESRNALRRTEHKPKTAKNRLREYSIRSNGPNPFNPQTSLQYAMPEAGAVQIVVYNLAGQTVRTLVNQQMPAGSYRLVWDGTSDNGREVASGVYLIDMSAGTFSDILKVTLAK